MSHRTSVSRSCKYCGRIHDENYQCNKKLVKRKKIDDIVRFRNSPRWQKKRKAIKKRDQYLCQICIRNLCGTQYLYTHKDLQVHHAVPIKANEELKLEDSNLITLCPMHHAMCDRGEIPCDEVMKIISEQENRKENEICL